ncbi:MAG: hypothetical protein AB1695_14170 [Stygiobacter sp.]
MEFYKTHITNENLLCSECKNKFKFFAIAYYYYKPPKNVFQVPIDKPIVFEKSFICENCFTKKKQIKAERKFFQLDLFGG